MSQQKTLYITNGDSAVGGLKAAGFSGDFLPIRDPLHVGPLLADDDFISDLSPRCQFIIDEQWASSEKVLQFQKERRETLKNIDQYQSIQLWFEHDLYDQLQLLWVLQFLAQYGVNPKRVKLVVTDLYLGHAYDHDFFELLRFQEAVEPEHYQIAVNYWQLLTSSNPNDWLVMIKQPHALFPFVAPAIKRFCQEFPACNNGLALTAQRVLELCRQEISSFDLFKATQKQEQAVFMGDTQFFDVVAKMANQSAALLDLQSTDLPLIHPDQSLKINTLGLQVLEHKKDYLELVEPNFWLGGVHLKPGNIWCYNDEKNSFKRRAS